MRRNRGSTLVILLVVCAVVALIIGVIVVPGLFSSCRASNERNATTSLKTLASAEADFRANDRDWNHVNDFWTADVKGLYTMTSSAVPGAAPLSTTDPSIKLIELSVAAADADGTHFPAGGETCPLSTFSLPMAKAGNWYVALKADRREPYAQDTLGNPPMGPCHHDRKFGFLSFPDSLSARNEIAIINEANTIYRAAATSPWRVGSTLPPGLANIPPAFLNWPDEKTLKAQWTKLK